MIIPLEDEFGDIIQKARQGLGMTLDGVASAAGLSPDTLAGMEGCKVRPSLNQVSALADLLHLQKERLWTIAEEKWSPAPPPAAILKNIIPVRRTVWGYAVMGYLLIDRESGEALAFDTAGSGQEMLQALEEHKLCLKEILLTHTHNDHIGGISLLLRRVEKTFSLRVHPAERGALGDFWDDQHDAVVGDGETIRFGRHAITALATPGHTPGGVCYHIGGACFVGDSIFAGSMGRSYSPQGYQTLLSSLREKILRLNEGTVLFPGHGPATTVGEEKAHNPF
ncbi:MAG: MBL fold metallo-hydrolase, partial [Nitrospirae bacterium]|nr:MBL fold metallo-hydrolase [Nitrospirota bacterium]